MPKKDSVTPIRQQYLDIKRQYPDAILFYRYIELKFACLTIFTQFFIYLIDIILWDRSNFYANPSKIGNDVVNPWLPNLDKWEGHLGGPIIWANHRQTVLEQL